MHNISMNTLFTITSYLFFLWVFRNILFWTSLWQTKEYRLDRMRVHLKETEQGKKLFFSFFSFFKWFAIFAYVFTLFHDNFIYLYELFVACVFFLQGFVALKEIYTRSLKRPYINIKAVVIVFLSLSFIFFLSIFPIVERFLWLLVLDRFVFIFVSIYVWLFSFPTELYRDFKVELAAKKMRELKDVLVIGITGSYGKSTTKEYISQILEKKFRVVKTQGSNNTPIGIANTVLKKLKKDTEIFVVEMGAYKKGEIAQLCNIVKPQIGVITAVSSQHLSLFGGLQKTMEAKYELIESLPRYGLALFNGNNANAYSMYEKTLETNNHNSRKASLYQCIYTKSDIRPQDVDADIFAYNIKPRKNHVLFDVVLKVPLQKSLRKITDIKTPVIGVHNIENILPALYIGSYFGMTSTELKETAMSLTSLPQTMTLVNGQNGASFIDDTFNSNPQSVLATLTYMKLYKAQDNEESLKILVLQPMIELGRNADIEHYKIAKSISTMCDYVLLTNKNYYKKIMEGIRDGGGKCEVRVGSANEFAKFITKKVSKHDVVVFEGKEAKITLRKLLKKLKK